VTPADTLRAFVPDNKKAHCRPGPELPILLGIVLAIGMTWPLVLYLGTDVPAELGDPLFDTWHVAWVGHALLNHPLDLFQANRFWPQADNLAFNDVMLGYAPAGVLGAQGSTR
jgi:hypothetical protein